MNTSIPTRAEVKTNLDVVLVVASVAAGAVFAIIRGYMPEVLFLGALSVAVGALTGLLVLKRDRRSSEREG